MLNVYDLKIAHPDIFKQFSVEDNLIVHYKCPQSEKLVQLYNHFNAIYFTLSGEKAMHIGDVSWHLTNEDSLMVCRGAYTQEMFKNLDWEVLAFHFNDDFLREIYHEFRLNFELESDLHIPKHSILKIKINPIIKTSFYTLLSFFNSDKKDLEYLLKLKIKELIINILAETANKNVRAYFNSVSDSHKRPIWQIMESNFMYNLSIEEFSRLSQRSISSFKKDFKTHYNISPGKWLLDKRLEFAKTNLVSSNRPINEIAYMSGFENTTHFSRVFRNKYGKSPSEIRKDNLLHT